MIHAHSLHAFSEHIFPVLTSKEMQVYRAIEALKRATMHEVAHHMGVELNTISGRFGRLRDKKMIEGVGVDRSSGSSRTIWSVKGDPKQLTMFKN